MTHAIGIDFGGTSIKSGLVAEGRIVEYGAIIDTQNHADQNGIVEALLEVIAKLRARDPNAAAIGIGLPGLVDSVNGIVHELTNVPGWHDLALRDLLQGRTGLPVAIENDANAMAYGEWKYGAARDSRHVICITLGTGVGGALILNGELFRGAQLGAGEIGHMSIDLHGRPGPYGNFGGLEEYVGNQQMAERAVDLYAQAGTPRHLAECTPACLATAARDGCPVAIKIWETLGEEIGAALSSVVWLLNPETIVIGGGVAKAGALIFEPIRRAIRARTSRVFHEYLHVVPAVLGNDAGIIGSAALAAETAGRP